MPNPSTIAMNDEEEVNDQGPWVVKLCRLCGATPDAGCVYDHRSIERLFCFGHPQPVRLEDVEVVPTNRRKV